MKRFLVLISLLLIPLCGWTANIYVDGGTVEAGATWDGVNGHSYSCSHGTGTGYSTIQAAITAMTGGDDIYLRGGTYQEHDIQIPSAKSGTSGNWSSLQSYPGEWAIIDGQRLNTNMVEAVIYNGYYLDCTEMDVAKYWKFERLEITGGGSSGSATAGGINWLVGPFTVRYCYIHDNYSDTSNENPAGINGGGWNNATIEYNLLYNNGATTTNGNSRQISTKTQEEGCYNANSAGDILHNGVKNNIIRYNYVRDTASRSDFGIGMKACNFLTEVSSSARDITDYTYRNNGDKIHHNIIVGSGISAIHWQNDWQQIYNNICDMTGQGDYYHGAITTRRTLSPGVDLIYPCVYNNTIVGGVCGLYNDADGKSFQTFQGLWVNNILDSPSEDTDDYPITLYHRADSSDNWYASRDFPDDFNITGVKVDRNYIYRGSQASGHDILFGKRIYSSGFNSGFTVASFESTYSVDLFIQATQESGSNKLFVNASASTADKYRTIGTHNLGETGKTIAANGYGAQHPDHPYLTGVTIPSYIGATNPSDDSWVAGVLALDVSYFTSATAGSDPTWIEGSTPTPAPPTISNVTISNGRVQ